MILRKGAVPVGVDPKSYWEAMLLGITNDKYCSLIDWKSVDGHFEVKMGLFMWKVTEKSSWKIILETSLKAVIEMMEKNKVKD